MLTDRDRIEVERVGGQIRERYRRLASAQAEGSYVGKRWTQLKARHAALVSDLSAKGWSQAHIERAVEDAERERVLDVVGLVEPDDE